MSEISILMRNLSSAIKQGHFPRGAGKNTHTLVKPSKGKTLLGRAVQWKVEMFVHTRQCVWLPRGRVPVWSGKTAHVYYQGLWLSDNDQAQLPLFLMPVSLGWLGAVPPLACQRIEQSRYLFLTEGSSMRMWSSAFKWGGTPSGCHCCRAVLLWPCNSPSQGIFRDLSARMGCLDYSGRLYALGYHFPTRHYFRCQPLREQCIPLVERQQWKPVPVSPCVIISFYFLQREVGFIRTKQKSNHFLATQFYWQRCKQRARRCGVQNSFGLCLYGPSKCQGPGRTDQNNFDLMAMKVRYIMGSDLSGEGDEHSVIDWR